MKTLRFVLSAFSPLILAALVLPAPATAASVQPPTANIISQCASNQFCMWGDSNYSGTFRQVSGSGVTYQVGRPVNSVWNNRSKAARLYNNAGTSYTCLAAGAKKSVLATTSQLPAKVTLAEGTSC
jgi:hypothetical protein